MPAQPHPSNEPHQAPRGPDGRLAAWAETAVLLAGLVSGAALVATILLLLILIWRWPERVWAVLTAFGCGRSRTAVQISSSVCCEAISDKQNAIHPPAISAELP